MMSYFFSYLSNVLVKTNWVPLIYSRKLFNSIGKRIPKLILIESSHPTVGSDCLKLTCLIYLPHVTYRSLDSNGCLNRTWIRNEWSEKFGSRSTYLSCWYKCGHISWFSGKFQHGQSTNLVSQNSFKQCNHIDLAPNYAGTLMGITNCCANIMSIIAPLVVGLIVKEEVSCEGYIEIEWTKIKLKSFPQSNSDQWRIVFFISAGVYFFGNLLFVIFSKTDVQYWNEPARRSKWILS